MGQIVSSTAKPKRCNANQLSQVPTPAAGEHILVSSDNSMNAAGQGNFDCYIVGNGKTAATALPLRCIADEAPTIGSKNSVSSNGVAEQLGRVFGIQEVELDLTIETTNGIISGGKFYNAGNYGTYHRCIFIPVGDYKGRTLRVTIGSGASPASYYITFLKAMPTAGASVEYADGINGVYNITSSQDFVIPNDAEYVYFYVTDTRGSNNYLPSSAIVTGVPSEIYNKAEADEIASELGARIDDVEDGLTFHNTEGATKTSETQGRVLTTQTIGSQVNLDTSAGFGNICTFNIPSGKTANVIFSSSTGSYGFALCDTNGNVIAYTTNTSKDSYTFEKQQADSVLYASSAKLDRVELIEDISVSEKINALDDEIESKQSSKWNGKTIWWCGTSIPAGSDATLGSDETIAGNYPTQVGALLGANIVNKSVGGSMCRANVRTGDYVGANFANITSALSMTKEEIESFITNYDTIKDNLTGNPLSTLNETYLNRLRAASFEDRLLPYLNGTYDMPDLFVFDHGHNDFKYTLSGGASDIGLEPTIANISGGELAADTYMVANGNAKLVSFYGSLANIPSASLQSFIASVNRNCFIGAVNFLVTLILRYNPHARIVFISNYEYEDGAAPVYAPLIPAQKSIADSWAFPLCEVYKSLGYSAHIIPSSMAWFNTTYPNVTPATTDINVFRAYCPDNVHPHSDTTGNANKVYAEVVAGFLEQV